MKRRHRRRHHPERQPRPSLEAIVRDCGCPADELACYVAFARELVMTLRRQPQASSRKLQAPDFSRGTKNVVVKWFRRGLSGHLMWLIGKAVLGKLE